VFGDIGVEDAEEELAKAQLASHVREVIHRSRLSQAAAATAMGITRPKVSALLNGRLTKFSSERLIRLLTRLGQDVEIVLRSTARRRQRGRIRVRTATVTADLEVTLRRVRAYRETDPNFESAIAKFAESEARYGAKDRVEATEDRETGSAQRMVRQLIRG
jgi:predicted XRE-type DNA-binding protein